MFSVACSAVTTAEKQLRRQIDVRRMGGVCLEGMTSDTSHQLYAQVIDILMFI
jgi:hypothetical protein